MLINLGSFPDYLQLLYIIRIWAWTLTWAHNNSN